MISLSKRLAQLGMFMNIWDPTNSPPTRNHSNVVKEAVGLDSR